MTVRLLLVTLATIAVCLILALVFAAPLEVAANPEVTPNPAKAPWYFLGLQELVGYSALVGGVIVPGVVVVGLAMIPFIRIPPLDNVFWGVVAAALPLEILAYILYIKAFLPINYA